MSGPVAQLGARFHGMEEVIGSIPIRSTKQPLTNQIAIGSSRPPSMGGLVSFGQTLGWPTVAHNDVSSLCRLFRLAATQTRSYPFAKVIHVQEPSGFICEDEVGR